MEVLVMALVCKVVRKLEELSGGTLSVGFPDENGEIVTIHGVCRADMDAVEEGESYALGMAPYTPAAAPAALEGAPPVVQPPSTSDPAIVVTATATAAALPVDTSADAAQSQQSSEEAV
jgi:hypothetical protein